MGVKTKETCVLGAIICCTMEDSAAMSVISAHSGGNAVSWKSCGACGKYVRLDMCERRVTVQLWAENQNKMH